MGLGLEGTDAAHGGHVNPSQRLCRDRLDHACSSTMVFQTKSMLLATMCLSIQSQQGGGNLVRFLKFKVKINSSIVGAAVALAAIVSIEIGLERKAAALSITTTYGSNNDGDDGGGVFFDINVSNPNGLRFTQIASNIQNSAGVSGSLTVYATALGGTYVGNTLNSSAWTSIASGVGTSSGEFNPTIIDVTDFVLSQGSYGILLDLGSSWGHAYTNGNGTNQVYSNSDLTLTLGAASNPIDSVYNAGRVYSPRVWNGTLEYEIVSASGPAASVPGPLPLFGVGAAFIFSRKLRKRIKSSTNAVSTTYSL